MTTRTEVKWSIGGEFLEALTARDFDRLGLALAPTVRFRALLPPGPAAWEGRQEVVGALRSWFGDAEDFELLDATVGEVGGRLHLAWRLRVRPAPFGIGEGWHVIEQQIYADAGETIECLDLLCSGFNAEPDRTAVAP
jgi:hypothetical protein